MRFTTVRGVAGLESIRGAWAAVTGAMTRRRFYQMYEWYSAFVRTLAPAPDAMQFTVAWRGEDPVAVFPLQRGTLRLHGLPLRSLGLPLHPHMPLVDVVLEPSDATAGVLDGLCEHLREEGPWDVLLLPRLLEDAAALFCLQRSRSPGRVVKAWDRCDTLLCRDYEARLPSYPKRFRNNLRRRQRHLESFGTVEFTREDRPEALSARLQAFLEVEASGWKGPGGMGTAIQCSDALRAFYERVAAEFGALGACHINLLRVNGACVAGEFTLVLDDTCYMLKGGYDEQYSKAAPGILLTDWQLREYGRDGRIEEMNYLNAVDWISEWGPRAAVVYRAWVFNRSLRGRWGAVTSRARWRTASLLGPLWREGAGRLGRRRSAPCPRTDGADGDDA